MNSPFPGMDPYLEDRSIYPGFHHSLAEEIKGRLNARLGTRYYADVELRTVGEFVEIGEQHIIYPDVGVYESELPETMPAYEIGTAVALAPLTRPSRKASELKLRAVHIYLLGTNRLVTTIELLSPYNKRYSDGLSEYKDKRARLLMSTVNFVEFDLLRGGERPGAEVADPAIDTDYVLLVNRYRGLQDRFSEIWPIALNESLPLLPIPLLTPDPDVILDLNAALREIYQRGAYHKRIDYRQPLPHPPPRPLIAEWLAARSSMVSKQ